MNLQERLKLVMQDSGLTIPDFAKKLSVAGSTLVNYRDGRTSPTFDLLMKICTEFSINPDWLLLGKGGIHPGEADEAGRLAHIDLAVQLVEEAVNETGVQITPLQKIALVQLIREELKTRTIDILKVIKGGGTKGG
ncbi:MAG: helix-turn-helix transcriptional regulator [Deltaproteobacteria bacterium]|nr:helix-turn-helix transcriptional regulator [Deltaproteobacteria bacterium]